ncbi:DUF4178 domain-containing protein [Neorhodopirellula lusitana]|uniref:DUF4178 domain-containing protein n=1 Tax=Neorhodopirellula lusitana TaxID=445327 RepID=UPI00384EFCBA
MKGARSLKKRGGPCPNCGAPVEFRFGGTLVTVCEFCNSAIARGDKDLSLIGKVSDLVETESLVQIGATGTYRGKPFEVIGRVQYQHSAGGVWDEWYLRFPGDKMAWLAEAQGQIHLTFPRPIRKKNSIPEFKSLGVGQAVTLGTNELTVIEKGTAVAGSAQGEIPWAFVPGASHTYADLQGSEGWFATFEYQKAGKAMVPHQASVGRTVAADELGVSSPLWESAPESAVKKVEMVSLNCPNCGGPIDLRVPDQTKRVGCPSCGSMLDVSKGKLEVLQTLDRRDVHPVLKLGSTGTLFGDEYTLIGFMERYATYQSSVFPWTEYLLYNPDKGFRWLVCNQNHWSFVESISAHGLNQKAYEIRYDGQVFRIYDRGKAFVRATRGEFYWKVRHGDNVRTDDFICPPRMISFESSSSDGNFELNVSLGTYMKLEEIEKAFGVSDLTRPWSVGVIQPKLTLGFGVIAMWAGFIFYLFVVNWIGNSVAGADRWLKQAPDSGLLVIGIILLTIFPAGLLLSRHIVEVQRWKDSDYSPYASDD